MPERKVLAGHIFVLSTIPCFFLLTLDSWLLVLSSSPIDCKFSDFTPYLLTDVSYRQNTKLPALVCQPMKETEGNKNYTFENGLVLSGGAYRSLGQAGAIKALEEWGIKPDVVCGTSSGAIMAVLYASGCSPEEIKHLWQKESFSEVLEPHIPVKGLLKSSKFGELIRPYLKYARLEDLPIPTLISCTCMNDGRQKVFEEGEILPLLEAACALPVLFEPVKIGGRQYVDGGLVSNLPVEPLEEKCRRLIGIYVNTVPEKKEVKGLDNMAYRTFRIGLNSNVQKTRHQCDWFIAPDELGERGLFKESLLEENFQTGYDYTYRFLEEKRKEVSSPA